MKRLIPILHTVFFTISPVLYLYSHLKRRVEFTDILPSFVAIIFSSVLIFSVVFFAVKKEGKFSEKTLLKTAILSSLAIGLFYSYGHLVNSVMRLLKMDVYHFANHIIPLLLIIALYIFSFRKILKSGSAFVNTTKLLNFFAGILIFFPLSGIIFKKNNSAPLWKNIKSLYKNDKIILNKGQIKKKPDIYYIILDRYAREDCLKKFYKFNNANFLKSLKNKGFFVASGSHANYLKSLHSISSSLNMTHLNSLSKNGGRIIRDRQPLQYILRNNRLMKLLKSIGYATYFLGTWWPPTSKNPNADVNINIYPIKDFSSTFIKTTAIFPLLLGTGIYNERRTQYKRALLKFKKIIGISQKPGPKFVFAHMLLPHDPFVFDKNGNFIPRNKAIYMNKDKAYINQLIFANKKINELVKTIISKSKIPPVIIIQSDEGPHPKRYLKLKHKFNWPEAEKKELMEKMCILNVLYIPDSKKLYTGITPVNTFRLVFNTYFNTKLKMLADKSYVFKNDLMPYNFKDISKKLNSKNKN